MQIKCIFKGAPKCRISAAGDSVRFPLADAMYQASADAVDGACVRWAIRPRAN